MSIYNDSTRSAVGIITLVFKKENNGVFLNHLECQAKSALKL